MAKTVLMLGTSPSVKGGITAVVATLRGAGFFDRARVRYIDTHVETGGLDKILQFGRALMRTLGALLRGQVTLVHAHVSSGASFWRKSMLLAIARTFRVPTIFHLHSGAFDSFASRGGSLRAAVVRYTLERSSVVIVLSNRWSEWVHTFAPAANVRVLPNPVNVPHRAGGGSEPDKKTSSKRVLYLGLVSESKGTFDLLRAWQHFSQDVPGWRLVIGGYGETDRMISEVQRLGLADSVDFLGWVAGSDKERELAHASIFVLPSYNEGMPVSILEAMAYGTPVIATAVGGIPDMIRPEADGILVPPGDIPKLAGALVRLATSRELRHRLGSSGRELVIDRYSTEKILDRLASLYAEIDKNSAQRRS